MKKEEKTRGHQPGSKIEGGHQPTNAGHQPTGSGEGKKPVPPTIDNTLKKGNGDKSE